MGAGWRAKRADPPPSLMFFLILLNCQFSILNLCVSNFQFLIFNFWFSNFNSQFLNFNSHVYLFELKLTIFKFKCSMCGFPIVNFNFSIINFNYHTKGISISRLLDSIFRIETKQGGGPPSPTESDDAASGGDVANTIQFNKVSWKLRRHSLQRLIINYKLLINIY